MNNNNLYKGAILLTLSSFAFIFSGYAINIWLGKTLGPENYGVYGIVITLMSLINLVQTSGLPQATSKFIAGDERKENEILRSSLVLQIISTLVITIVFYFLAVPIAGLLNDSSLVPYLRLSSLIFPFYGIFSLYSGYYNGRHLFHKQAIINISYSLAKLFAVIALAYLFHLKGALAGFVVAPIVALLFGFSLPRKSDSHFPYKKLIYFSLPLIAFSFLSMLQQSVDLYFIKSHLMSNELAGFYSANQNIARIPLYALSAITLVLFPGISKSLSENNHSRVANMISDSLRYTLLILVPVTVMLSATSGQILEFLFSKEYLPGTDSLSWLMFSFAFVTLYSVLANILNGAGYPYKSVIVIGFSVLLSGALCFLLVPRYGLLGASVATGISAFIAVLMLGYFVFRHFRILLPMESLVKILISGAAAYFVSLSINLPPVLLVFNYLISGVVYLGLLHLLKETKKEDYNLAKSLIPAKLLSKYAGR